jgi:hypothetical protein
MPLSQHTSTLTGDAESLAAVHLLLTEGEIRMMAENPEQNPEQVMEEIQVRATQVSSVLEGILLEPHGRPDWGINE